MGIVSICDYNCGHGKWGDYKKKMSLWARCKTRELAKETERMTKSAESLPE